MGRDTTILKSNKRNFTQWEKKRNDVNAIKPIKSHNVYLEKHNAIKTTIFELNIITENILTIRIFISHTAKILTQVIKKKKIQFFKTNT